MCPLIPNLYHGRAHSRRRDLTLATSEPITENTAKKQGKEPEKTGGISLHVGKSKKIKQKILEGALPADRCSHKQRKRTV